MGGNNRTSLSCHVIEDTNFLVSVIDHGDKFRLQAELFLKLMLKHDIVYVFPEIVIKEACVVLMKAGYSNRYVRSRINNLSMIPKVIIQDNDILTTLRYTSKKYNQLFRRKTYGIRKITSTNDYIIACNAIDYNAIFIGGDSQVLSSLSAHGINCFNFHEEKDLDKLSEVLEEHEQPI